jgi:hypothetical protein
MLIAAFLALVSLVGLVLSITSGLIFAGVDGLFIVLVCLLMAAIFGGNALSTAARLGYIPVPARFRKAHN